MALVLECHVTGSPLPEISWYQDSKRIAHDSQEFEIRDDGSHSVLRIDHMTPEYSGNYTCRARNVGGETVSSASVRVIRTYSERFVGIYFLSFFPVYYVKTIVDYDDPASHAACNTTSATTSVCNRCNGFPSDVLMCCLKKRY